MSENKTSGDLMSELQKLQSEISENSSSSSAKLGTKSTFEKFRNEQNKFNSEMIETLRMMRQEMTCGMAEISFKKEAKQKNIHEKTLENLETIEDEKMKLLAEQMFDEKVLKKLEIIRKGFKEMDEKQEKISKDMQEMLENMRNDVTLLEEKKHEKSLIRVHVKNLVGKLNDFVLVPGDTIFSLKLKIQDKDGIAADRIRLICEADATEITNESDEMPDVQKLQSEYSRISSKLEENPVQTVPNFVENSIFEKFKNEQNQFNDKVTENFQKIREEMKRGITEIRQTFDKKVLEKATELEGKLKAANEKYVEIKRNSKIPMNFTVKCDGLETLYIEVNSDKKVSDLKWKIYYEHKIEIYNQRLYFQGLLKDWWDLCDLPFGATIEMVKCQS